MNDEKLTTYFSLGIASGFLIIVGALFSMIWWSYPMGLGYQWMGRMMYGWGYGFSYHMATIGAYYGFVVVGIISGAVVIISSILLYRSPRQAALWGAILLVASVTSFVAMGGFFVGALLGFVTGLLAIFSGPKMTLQQTRTV
ncbi:MAG: hypothetical protein JRN68_01835 [Nitrososphaerota archaeon]|jgi:hypothetical protein|nr:hypothetical protein [Nitrososphaerota archaeon]